MTIPYDAFEAVNLRSGTIVKVEEFPRAKKPAFKIWANFGPTIGVLQTSAQVTVRYTPETLLGRQIVGCVNLAEKNIAGFTSPFLLVGWGGWRHMPDHSRSQGSKWTKNVLSPSGIILPGFTTLCPRTDEKIQDRIPE